MTARFTVLASGSAGNSSLLETDRGGVLIDFGLSARQLGARLHMCGFSWRSVQAAVLTHTHGDHWRETAIKALLKHRVTLYCHPGHALELMVISKAFDQLRTAGLVQTYEPLEWLELSEAIRVRPLPVEHDGGPTCAFRFEGPGGMFGPKWALGYATDLGCWNEQLVADLAEDVDVLALEFNHDIAMQKASGRPRMLVDRILGDRGHLSNCQAAAFLRAALGRSSNIGLRYMIGLHPSRECNHPDLALAAAQGVFAGMDGIQVMLACQHEPTPVIEVRPETANANRPVRRHNRPMTATTGSGFFDA
ncbi:MAG: MBL fold metallo-hydrolase [Gemmataceae bacterium]